MYELWYVDSHTIKRKLLLSDSCKPALSISHETCQITFKTILWDWYCHYPHLTDEETEGEQGRTDTKRKVVGYEPRLSEARIHACYLPDCKALTALGTTVSVHQCHLLSQSIFQHEDQLLLPRKLINILKRDQWWNVGSSKDQQWWSTKHWKTPEKCRRAITEPWISSKYWQIVTHKSPCLAF